MDVWTAVLAEEVAEWQPGEDREQLLGAFHCSSAQERGGEDTRVCVRQGGMESMLDLLKQRSRGCVLRLCAAIVGCLYTVQPERKSSRGAGRGSGEEADRVQGSDHRMSAGGSAEFTHSFWVPSIKLVLLTAQNTVHGIQSSLTGQETVKVRKGVGLGAELGGPCMFLCLCLQSTSSGARMLMVLVTNDIKKN